MTNVHLCALCGRMGLTLKNLIVIEYPFFFAQLCSVNEMHLV